MKSRPETNKIENREKKKNNKIISFFFFNINKIDRPLTRLTKNKRQKTQITKIRNESRDISIDPTE